MGYADIPNLYKSQEILLFKECYALEKIHGTSTRIIWKDDEIHLLPGGCGGKEFEAIFNLESLKAHFLTLGHPEVHVYGEGYGGKMQKMSATYGKTLRFIAFEVRIEETWLAVPQAEDIVRGLGLEFVHYNKVPADMAALGQERAAPSVQAVRNGMGPNMPREGIVLRPLIELRKSNGERIISKYKNEQFEERQHQPKATVDPTQLQVITEAEAIAMEWVVLHRLEHVLQSFPEDVGIERTRDVINAMVQDVYKESKGEIVESKAATKAISSRAAQLFKQYLQSKLPL